MKLSETHPHAYGMLATALGVLVFVPDALLLRLIGGDVLAMAFWRGILAGSVFLFWSYFVSGAPRMSVKQSISGPYLLIAIFEGGSMVLFCASIGHTSVSNTLFIFSTAPFIAAVLSWIFLRELIPLQTIMAIFVSMIGVIVIVSGSFGDGSLLGDGLAFLNACTVAGFYVVLRKIKSDNIFPSLGAGYIIGALAVSPFANFESYSITQAGLLLLNGALIIPLAIGLLSVGPRYLPAAEVSMFSVLEVIFAPLLVWIVLGENPGGRSIFGGIVILTAIFAHTFWRLKYNKE